MADDTLRIRVDVETATLGQLKEALKAVNAEMQVASREQLPVLQAESKAIGAEISSLTGKTQSLTQITKESRQEARLFNFAILELAHAFRGLGDILGVVTGASEETKTTIKDMTSTLQESVGAGLGAAFALKAFGGSMAALAGPVGIAVGASTALFGAIAKVNEEFNRGQEATRKEAEKLNDLKIAAAGLEVELGIITRQKYIEILTANAEALRKTAEDSKTSVGELNIAAAVLSGLTGNLAIENAVKYHDVQKSQLQTQQEINKTLEADKKTQDEITKSSKENAEALRRQQEEDDKDLEYRLAIARAMEDTTKATVGTINTAKPLTLINVLQLKLSHDLMNQIKDDLAEITSRTNEIAHVFTDAFMNAGIALNEFIIDKLGLATSVFEKFVADVIRGILRIAEELAAFSIVKGIFSLFGFGFFNQFIASPFASGGVIDEPIFGVGQSGRTYTFGERGREIVTPMSRDYSSLYSGGAGQPIAIMIQGEFVARGRDMMSVVKKGVIYERKSGWKGF